MNNRYTTIIGWILTIAVSLAASYGNTKRQISDQDTRISVIEVRVSRTEMERAEERADRKELQKKVEEISENVIAIKGSLNLKADKRFKE